MPYNGAALDARLRNKLLLDPKLQRRTSGDEFRSFINLLVWSVSLVSDGVFDAEEADMVVQDPAHLTTLAGLGLIDVCDDTGRYRIAPEYQSWQTTKAEIEKRNADRERDRERKRAARAKPPAEPEWEPVGEAPY